MGDQEFTELIDTNKESIYRICRLYATGTTEPDDLFQEIIFQVWKSIPNFKGEASINTWIYRIALNVSYRSNLKSRKVSEKMMKLDTVKFENIIDTNNKEEEIKYKILYDCMRQLEKADQSILVLYLEELAYKEIAEVVGISENYVAVKMKRIRKTLFQCMTPKLEHDEG